MASYITVIGCIVYLTEWSERRDVMDFSLCTGKVVDKFVEWIWVELNAGWQIQWTETTLRNIFLFLVWLLYSHMVSNKECNYLEEVMVLKMVWQYPFILTIMEIENCNIEFVYREIIYSRGVNTIFIVYDEVAVTFIDTLTKKGSIILKYGSVSHAGNTNSSVMNIMFRYDVKFYY